MYDQEQIGPAVERLVERGQQWLVNRVELARCDARVAIRRAWIKANLTLLGAIAFMLGWVALMVAAVRWLSLQMALDAAIVLIGAPHVVAGVIMAAIGMSTGKARDLENSRQGET